jgi:hypothetical protein
VGLAEKRHIGLNSAGGAVFGNFHDRMQVKGLAIAVNSGKMISYNI